MIHRIIKKKKKLDALVPAPPHGGPVTAAPAPPIELKARKRTVRRLFKVLGIFSLAIILLAGAAFGLLYMRLAKGNIDLAFLVPSIERSINEQLTDLTVRIDNAFVGRNLHSFGVHFRLRNLVLHNSEGEALANAPLAAVGLNPYALLWGQVAPSQVVFIRPTLDMVYKEGEGLSLSYNGEALKTKGGAGASRRDPIGELMSGMGFGDEGSGIPSVEETIRQLQNVDLMKAVTAAFQEARSHQTASSYLTQFGVRDAVIKYSQGDAQHSWWVPDFILDLRHQENGSVIRGYGELAVSNDGEENIQPWKLRFQAQQVNASNELRLDLAFQNVTPLSMRNFLPAMDQVQIADLPIDGKLTARFAGDGRMLNGFANFRVGEGQLVIPGVEGGDFRFEGGEIKLAYDPQARNIHLLPSPLQWGENHTVLTGVVKPPSRDEPQGKWSVSLRGEETRVAASDFGLKPITIDEWGLAGAIDHVTELVDIERFYMQAGNAGFQLSGRIEKAFSNPGVYASGKVGSFSMPVLKRLWPAVVAPEARTWLGEQILDGRIVGGHLNVALPPGVINDLVYRDGDIAQDMITLDMELGDLSILYDKKLVPAYLPQARMRIAGRQFSVDVPKASVELAGVEKIRLSHLTYVVADLRKKIPDADLTFRAAGSSRSILTYFNQPDLHLIDDAGLDMKAISGKVKGVVAMSFPLKKDLRFEQDVSLKGDLRMTQLKIAKRFAGMPVTAGSLDISVTEKGIEGEGGIVVQKIPVKVQWQRIFGPKKLQQPPVRLSASLGAGDRVKLGLGKLNDVIEGSIPVVATMLREKGKKPVVQVRADMTNVRIGPLAMGWEKSTGAVAVMQFDLHKQSRDRHALRNLNFVSNEVQVEGELVIDERRGVVDSFNLPKVSYALVNNMSIEGKRSQTGLLSVKAHVKSLDGRKVLRPLFLGNGKPNKLSVADERQKTDDLDVSATVDRIIGDQGVSINNSKLEIRRRNGEVNWVDFKGKLNQGELFAIRLEREEDQRRYLKVESHDAGSTLRLLGLFPNVEGGQLSLKVDMDQKGAAEKSGTLWARNFSVIGEQTVDPNTGGNKVFTGMIDDTMQPNKSRGTVRKIKTRMRFQKLKAPFQYGEGQLVLRDSYVNGPVIGATLRGKIDFRRQRMRLGGTYVPLYGLNSAISEIPVLSQLLVGRQGEGVFGVTFAIQGPLSRPVMIVNPVSLLAPGVLRQIFDFNNTVSNRQIKTEQRKQKRKQQRNSRPVN